MGMIAIVIQQPLSARIVVLSWAAALLAWPAVWLLLVASQGVGVVLAGGEWIGVALPWGSQPWALVNEPVLEFAITRGALWGYWLAPLLAAALLAFVPPLLVPSRGWVSELLIFQLSSGAALLGLGWAPPLGVDDGPAAGLARFWGVSPTLVVVASTVVGAIGVQLALLRLSGHLWALPGGPLRRRRVAVWVIHGAVPVVLWIVAVVLSGWPLPRLSWPPVAVILVCGLLGSVTFLARAPLRPRPDLGRLATVVVLALGVLAGAAWLWAGAPAGRQGKALLWRSQRETSNVRPGMVEVDLMQRLHRAAPPAR